MLAKKTRKILSLAMAMVVVISMLTVFAMADEGGDICPDCKVPMETTTYCSFDSPEECPSRGEKVQCTGCDAVEFKTPSCDIEHCNTGSHWNAGGGNKDQNWVRHDMNGNVHAYVEENCDQDKCDGNNGTHLRHIALTYSHSTHEIPHQHTEVKVQHTCPTTPGSETGILTVAKAFSGVEALPSTFEITVTGPEGFDPIVLDVNNADSGKNYTWTLRELPIGNYTVTESGYDVAGHTCTTINTNGGTTAATLTLTEDGASVTFTNTYTLNTPIIPLIVPTPSDPPGGDVEIPDPSDPLGDGGDIDITDPSDPLGGEVEIPDEGDPLSDAPQTGDINNIFLLIAIMISCAFGLVIINLPRKKRNEA